MWRSPGVASRAVRCGLCGLTAIIAMVSALSCGREVTGPERGTRLSRALAIQPMFRALQGQAELSSGVEFARLRLTFERLDGTLAFERVLDFPANADSLRLTVNVPLDRNAPSAGEQMIARLALITSVGDSVFRGGPDTVLMEPARAGVPPAERVMNLRYTGPGSQATRVVLTPTSFDTTSGSALTFSAQAFDAQSALVPNAPVLFTSSDTALLRFTNARSGSATTSVRRGSALAIASLLTGPADSSTVALALPASRIAAVSGGGQSAVNGTALPAPVVVFVSASDSVAVPGVTVLFAAAAGGQITNASVVTDANGRASTTWTLGTSSGVQNLTATATGLTGSPVAFTASALAGIATQLAFVTQPSSATAGASVGTMTIQARDASGNLDATYVGAVTIGIGTNPGGGALSGTTTVNAVGGVATIPGLSVNLAAAGYTLTASASGLTGTTSAPFTIAAGSAAALAFSVPPTATAAGAPITPAVQVAARDVFGNAVSAYTGAVTIAIGDNPGGAMLSGSTTVNAIGGVATFAGLSLNLAAAGYTLTASASGLTGATSAAFATSAERIEWTNAAGGLWSAPANWSLARAPRQSDSVVIALPGTYTVTLDTTFVGTLLTVGGGSGAQTLALASRTVTLAGPLSIQSTGVLELRSAVVASPVVNAGTLDASGLSSVSGALTTTSGSMLHVLPTVSPGADNTLTVANGFTNLGTILLGRSDALSNARLVVSSGTLVNAPEGGIAVLGNGAPRTLVAELDNQGLIAVNDNSPLEVILPLNAVWENSGSISLGAENLTISQSGPTASFTNRGTVVIGTGRTLTVQQGTFTHAAGASLTGDGTLLLSNLDAVLDETMTPGLLTVSSSTLSLGAGVSTAGMTIGVNSATVTGAGTITISSGRGLSLSGGTVVTPVQNAGQITVSQSSTVSGPLTTTSTSWVTVNSGSTLTVSNGFTNEGVIQLSEFSGGGSAALTVGSGTLVNAAGGNIFPGNGIEQTITARLDNQGRILGGLNNTGRLRIIGDVTTSGLIELQIGGLTPVTQHGQVAVTGALTLGGTLLVSLADGYIPVIGNTFTLLTSTGATSGAFTTSTLAPPLGPPPTYGPNSVAVGVPLVGAQIAWTNTAGGSWNTPANWDLGRVPNSADSVTIAVPGTYTVTLDTAFAGTRITVGGGAGTQTLSLTSRTLALTGPLSVQSTGALALNSATVAAPVVNAGTVRASGKSNLNGALTTVGGSTLRVAAIAPVDTNTLTVATGFTNLGAIELSNDDASGGRLSTLTVSSGTLVNAPTGTITALAGAASNNRTINALVDNQGSISVPGGCCVNVSMYPPTDAVWENTGTIALGAGATFVIYQTGASASLTNRGTVTGGQFAVFGGGFTHAAGATLAVDFLTFSRTNVVLDEAFTTLSRLTSGEGSTLTLGASASTAGSNVYVSGGTTITGSGTLTISAGKLLSLDSATVTVPVENAGLVSAWGASTISGPLTTTAGSTLQITALSARSDAALTVANGFTNLGLIWLRNSPGLGEWGAALTVTNGTLLNSPGGTIRVISNGGGPRTLTAALDNQGTLDIYPDSAGLFTINGNVTTSGIINVDVGGLTAGTQYGRVAVNGTLSLGGTLNAGLFGGYVPVSGNVFTILTSSGATTGTFTTSNLTAPLAAISYPGNGVTIGVP